MTGKHSPTLADILDRCRPVPPSPPNVLQTLLTVQEALGHVPLDGLNEISCALGVTEADVAGVLSYYPDLRTRPSGRHLIRVCMGESCMANHCGRVLREFQDHLRIGVGDTAPGGRFRLEHVYCLGNCAVSPTVVVDGELYGRVTPSQIGTLLERYK